MRKGFIGILSGGLLAFYIGIIMYVFFLILPIEAVENFESAIAFEIIGFLLITYFIMSNLLSKHIKTGFLVPLVMVTVIYMAILVALNIACLITMPHAFFVLSNLILLFIYSLISIPMCIMGKR